MTVRRANRHVYRLTAPWRSRPRSCQRLALIAAAATALLLTAVAPANAGIGYTAYVGNSGSGGLTPINTALNVAGSVIGGGENLPGVKEPSSVAISPDGRTAWVSNWSASTVTPVNLSTGADGNPIPVGAHPEQIAITPDGTAAYVTDNGSNAVTPIDLLTRTAGPAIPVGREPYAIAITPDGSRAYVTNAASGTLTPIDLASASAGAPVPVGNRPEGVAISPDGSTAWVAGYASNTLTPVTLATGTPGSPITVASPDAVAITPDGATAYVADQAQGTVTPVNLASLTAGTPMAVGAEPFALAITPDQATLYVADYGAGAPSTVAAIDLLTQTLESVITVGSGPDAVAIAPDQAPVASFTVSPGHAGAPSTFDAAASTVAYGSITSYTWSFGDGSTASSSGPVVSHTYSAPGTYTARLVETDSAGTSLRRVFTGQTVSRDGSPLAQTARTFLISAGPAGSHDAAPSPHRARIGLPDRLLTLKRNGDVLVPLSCPVSAASGCRGTVTIRLAEPAARPGRAVASRCARGCRVLGSANYTARAGQRVNVRVHMASFSRRLVAARQSVRAIVIATAIASSTAIGVEHPVTLRAPARERVAHGRVRRHSTRRRPGRARVNERVRRQRSAATPPRAS